jgi:hypothetical protein
MPRLQQRSPHQTIAKKLKSCSRTESRYFTLGALRYLCALYLTCFGEQGGLDPSDDLLEAAEKGIEEYECAVSAATALQGKVLLLAIH